MGKNLIITGADFSENCIENKGYSGRSHIIIYGINIVGANEIAFFGRLTQGSTTRATILRNDDNALIYVPKGATITLTGVAGLKLDYAAYSQQHNPSDFRTVSASKVMQYGVETTVSNNKPLHPFMLGSYSNGDSTAYFSLTDGVQDTVTVEADNSSDRYFAFVGRKPDNTTIHDGDFTVDFEVNV